MALARAFLKSPRVLLCDEATSALDSRTEKEVRWGHGSSLGGAGAVRMVEGLDMHYTQLRKACAAGCENLPGRAPPHLMPRCGGAGCAPPARSTLSRVQGWGTLFRCAALTTRLLAPAAAPCRCLARCSAWPRAARACWWRTACQPRRSATRL